MKMPKLGQRVRVVSIDVKGSVEFIDWPRIYLDYYYPIQIKLDKPYDGQLMHRTSLRDIKKLKKKSPKI